MSPESIRRHSAGLDSLPQELVDQIFSNLERRHILALTYVSKTIRPLAEQLLYTLVTVRDNQDFASLARVLLTKPHLRNVVQDYWATKRAPWWSLDLLSSLHFLHSFTFRPKNTRHEYVPRMVQNLAAAGWITPSLRRCSIELFYHNIRDVPEDTIDQLLYALLSAPALKAVTATYIRDPFMSDYFNKAFQSPSLDCPPPILPRNKYTDLQELHLHWDHLSLRRLSTLLHLPRNLEVLHLSFNSSRGLNCHDLVIDRFHAEGRMISQGAAVNYTGAAMHMNEALRPVAHSLRELAISLFDDVDRPEQLESCSDRLDFHWGHSGLREFEKLDFLRVPPDAWDLSGMYIPVGNLDLPKSLRTLHLDGFLLITRGTDAWYANSEYAMIPQGSLTVSGIGGSHFNQRAMLDATHGLSYILVSPGPSVDLDSIQRHRPPVFMPPQLEPLADRGIRILVELPGGGRLELETRRVLPREMMA